ncbi:MAG: universal stress protein [Chromatiales bacterium]|nr:universal stress protein [Chromatiales bacterium]
MNEQPCLCVIDPTTDYQPAVARAAQVAAATGRPLILLACLYDPHLAGERFYDGSDLKKLRRSVLEEQLSRMREMAEPLRNRGIQVTCRAVWDHPLHEAIVREALRVRPALVFKDTHHHPVLLRTLFTHTDWHLIRECPFPLWLVKRMPQPGEATVLATVDPLYAHDKPASLDQQIIDLASVMANALGRRLELLHAWPGMAAGAALPLGAPLPAPPDKAQIAALKSEHQQALDSLARQAGIPASRTHLEEGDPATLMQAAAERLEAGVIVMGAVARSRLRRAVLGSTAERVLEQLPCDALIVKPEGFISPVGPRGRAPGYLAVVVE